MQTNKIIKKRQKTKHAVLGILCIFIFCFFAVLFLSHADVIENSSTGDCPKSIREFVKRYPEAISLAENYKEYSGKESDMDLSGEDMGNDIPLLIQWDKRWAYYWYGDDYFGTNGCGPTCMAMVYSGLTGDTDWSPARMGKWAEEQGYYFDGSGTTWAFMYEGAEKLGLSVMEISMTENMVKRALSEGCPVICSMGPGTFTKGGHYIVIAGIYDDGTLQIHDPNSFEKSMTHWQISDFSNQVRAAWTYNY